MVRGQRIALGDDVSDRYGFDDKRLNERILRIIVALALRRCGGGSGWMTSTELGVLALAGASATAVAKLLETSLRDAMRVGPRLIEYQPSVASGGGRSRGPYRLGIAPEKVLLDEEACWSFLAGQALTEDAQDDRDLAVRLDEARVDLHAGRLVHAQSRTRGILRSFFEGADDFRRNSDSEQRFWLAQTYSLLANVDLELGTTKSGLCAAELARGHFQHVRHPEGVAVALQIEAHLRGQLEDPDEMRRSFVAARNALLKIDNASPTARKGVQRAAYIGTVGHRQSQLGQNRPAIRRLMTAYRLCEEASSRTWSAIWAIRIGQNAIAAGEPAVAERFMSIAHDAADALTISGHAALTRGMGELYLMTGRLDEAERWILRAREVGDALAMGYQRHLAEKLFMRLAQRRA